jgi:Rrf2 family iron-sulfur cluster assembly transcriptional regulator
MKLTTKGRYAVTAMLDLALHTEDGPVSLAEISERQDISLSYLEQLFSKLRKKDLVVSMRGPGGGYRLSRGAKDIAVADIILAVDEKVDITRCGGMGDCSNEKGRCLTHDLWMGLSEQIQTFLSGISLMDMMSRKDVVDIASRQENVTPLTIAK